MIALAVLSITLSAVAQKPGDDQAILKIHNGLDPADIALVERVIAADYVYADPRAPEQ